MVKRISLINVDSKIPNLALMKISSYYKQKGDIVGFNLKNPDIIFSSIIFKKNKGFAENNTIDGVKRVFGGSGYNLSDWLPDHVEYIKPDYDLYPSTYSQGFTTRGCINKCHFCVVPLKEGKLQRWQHPKEFYDERFKEIMIMDNNWLADRDWFFDTSQWIIDQGLSILEHGLDIRLVDREIVGQLQDLKIKLWHFAFDFTYLEETVRKKVELLKDSGVNIKNKVSFYVYCDSDLEYDDALYRCNVLRKLGTNANVMFNCDNPKTKRIKDLMKWSWRRCLYWKIPFQEYSSLCHT